MNIQEDELKYKSDSTLSFFGTKIDQLTLITFSLGVVLSIFIWVYFGLYNHGYNKYFLFALCIFLIVQIFTSGTYIGSFSIEDNEVKEVVQLNAVLFSSITILLAFGNGNFTKENNKMLVIALLLSMLSIIYYSVQKNSESKRTIRKLKVAFMTISVFVFMNMLFNLGVEKFDLLNTT
jgi:hypothetical protein